jgi:hypothetical protein
MFPSLTSYECHLLVSSLGDQNTNMAYVKVHKVDGIWFRSLDCGITWALLNTHSALLAATLFTRLPTLICTGFMTHIAPAITLAPNNHNKHREGKYIPVLSLLYKGKLEHTPSPVIYHITKV